jgi:hypothetical protein
MEIAYLGGVFALAVVTSIVLVPRALPWVLSAAVPFSATAAVIVGDNGVIPFYLIAIVLAARAVLRYPHRQPDLPGSCEPGRTPLLLFGVWTIAITALGPVYFAGLSVLDPRGGIDDQVLSPATLTLKISNLAQAGYLLLGLVVVLQLGRLPALPPRLAGLGFAIGTVLSTARGLLPESLQRKLFDTSPTVRYINTTPEGEERLRGIFSEPSGLASFSITAIVFFVMTASRSTGRLRAGCLVMGAWCLVNLSLSSSGTALIGGIIVVAVIVAQAVGRFVSGAVRWSREVLVLALAAVPVVIVVLPLLFDTVLATVDDKIDSDSYQSRSTADLFSLDLAWQTWGLGVGLGSNRPSSFLAMLLSCTGLIGTVLFLAAVTRFVRHAARLPEFQPTAWALVALLVSKLVAGPDMSEPVMWILIGICANVAWRASPLPAGRAVRPPEPFDPAATRALPRVRRPLAGPRSSR